MRHYSKMPGQVAVLVVGLVVLAGSALLYWRQLPKPESEPDPEPTEEADDRSRTLSPDKKAWVDAAGEARRAATERFFNRRDLEWKLALALWAGLLLAAAASTDTDFSRSWTQRLTVLLILLVILHAVWEIEFVARGAQRDSDDGVAIDKEIRKVLDLDDLDVPGPSEYRAWLAHGWPAAVTAILVSFVIAIVRA